MIYGCIEDIFSGVNREMVEGVLEDSTGQVGRITRSVVRMASLSSMVDLKRVVYLGSEEKHQLNVLLSKVYFERREELI